MKSPKLNEKELAAELENYLKSYDITYKNFWYHNLVGITIRKTLIEGGRWKTKTGPNKRGQVKPTEELSPKNNQVTITEKEAPKQIQPPQLDPAQEIVKRALEETKAIKIKPVNSYPQLQPTEKELAERAERKRIQTEKLIEKNRLEFEEFKKQYPNEDDWPI